MKKLLTCPVCGGHLKLNIETGLATCESCGEPREANAAEVKKLLDTCSRAERYTRQNTAAGLPPKSMPTSVTVPRSCGISSSVEWMASE